MKLTPAPSKEIFAAIKDAYDAAEAKGDKPPNIVELPDAVRPLLEENGYRTSEREIQKIGKLPEFLNRRRSRGATISSERRKQQK